MQTDRDKCRPTVRNADRQREMQTDRENADRPREMQTDREKCR